MTLTLKLLTYNISNDVTSKLDTSNFPKTINLEFQLDATKSTWKVYRYSAGGAIIEEFVGLKAKLYSYKMLKGEESKKYKGLKNPLLRRVYILRIKELFVFEKKSNIDG